MAHEVYLKPDIMRYLILWMIPSTFAGKKAASARANKTTLFALWLSLITVFAASVGNLVLWYQHPATNAMNEALAVGDGRMGALVFGQPERERLCVNEDSLWTDDENPSGNYDTMGA